MGPKASKPKWSWKYGSFELINDTNYVARITYEDRESDKLSRGNKLRINFDDNILYKIELCGIPGKKTVSRTFESLVKYVNKVNDGGMHPVDVVNLYNSLHIGQIASDLNFSKSRSLSILFESELEMIKKYHESAEVYSVKGDWEYITSMDSDNTTLENKITTKITDSNETTNSSELSLGFEGVFKAITLSAAFKSSTSMVSLRLNEQTDQSGITKKYNTPKDIYQEVLIVNSSIGEYRIGTQHIVAMEVRHNPTDEDCTVYQPRKK